MTRQKLTFPGWQLITLLTGAAITWIFLTIPIPRQFGLTFRRDFLPVVALLALPGFILLQLPDKISRLFLFGLTSAILAIGLAYLCAYLPWKIIQPEINPEQSLKPVLGLGSVLLVLLTVVLLIPFHLIPKEAPPVPLIRNKTFATRVHNLPNWETYPLFTGVKPGQVILVDLDLQTDEPMILIADWDEVGEISGAQTVCGRPSDEYLLREYNVYFAEEYLPG